MFTPFKKFFAKLVFLLFVILVPLTAFGQASTGVTTADENVVYNDVVGVGISPNTVPTGQQVRVGIKINLPKDELTKKVNDPKVDFEKLSYVVTLLRATGSGSQTTCQWGTLYGYKDCEVIVNFGARPLSDLGSDFLPDPSSFPVGKTQRIIAEVSTRVNTVTTGSSSKVFKIYMYGGADLTVQNTGTIGGNGAASVTVTKTDDAPGGIVKEYKITYIPPTGQTVTVTSVVYNCGFSDSKNETTSSLTFRCETKKQKPEDKIVFKPKVTLKLSNGKELVIDVSADSNTAGDFKTSTTGQSAGDLGSTLLGLINRIIAAILTIIIEVVYAIFWFVLVPIIQAVLSIRTYKDAFANVIYPGWEVIRNLCNVGFVVSMLWMGLSQVFGLDGYNYKKGLGKLIIAALLVNFSLVIPQAILAVSETVQNQFLPNNTTVIRALGYKLMVDPMTKLAVGSTTAPTQLDVTRDSGNFGVTARIVLYFFMAIAAFFVFCALALNLVVRLIALWALLLVSPVAFAGDILPATAKFKKQWWSAFQKYVLYTPVIAFLLNLTALMTERIDTGLQRAVGTAFSNSSSDTITSLVFTVLPNFLLLGFMYACISAAKMTSGIKVFDNISNKLGGKALGLAETSMQGKPFKALGEAGEITKINEGARMARDMANRALLKDDRYKNNKAAKAAFNVLNAKPIAKEWYAKNFTRTREEGQKKTKEAITSQYQTFGKPTDFTKAAADMGKKKGSDFNPDNVKAFKKVEGKTDNESRLVRMGTLMRAINSGNIESFLKDNGYASNWEGFVKLLDDEQKKGVITAKEREQIQKEAFTTFEKKNKHTFLGLRDAQTGDLRTLTQQDKDKVKQEQIDKFQQDTLNGQGGKKSGLTLTGYDDKGNLHLNHIGAAHIAHSQDPNRPKDLENAKKQSLEDKKFLNEIDLDPAKKQQAVDAIIQADPALAQLAQGTPAQKAQAQQMATQRWDDYVAASKQPPKGKGNQNQGAQRQGQGNQGAQNQGAQNQGQGNQGTGQQPRTGQNPNTTPNNQTPPNNNPPNQGGSGTGQQGGTPPGGSPPPVGGPSPAPRSNPPTGGSGGTSAAAPVPPPPTSPSNSTPPPGAAHAAPPVNPAPGTPSPANTQGQQAQPQGGGAGAAPQQAPQSNRSSGRVTFGSAPVSRRGVQGRQDGAPINVQPPPVPSAPAAASAPEVFGPPSPPPSSVSPASATPPPQSPPYKDYGIASNPRPITEVLAEAQARANQTVSPPADHTDESTENEVAAATPEPSKQTPQATPPVAAAPTSTIIPEQPVAPVPPEAPVVPPSQGGLVPPATPSVSPEQATPVSPVITPPPPASHASAPAGEPLEPFGPPVPPPPVQGRQVVDPTFDEHLSEFSMQDRINNLATGSNPPRLLDNLPPRQQKPLAQNVAQIMQRYHSSLVNASGETARNLQRDMHREIAKTVLLARGKKAESESFGLKKNFTDTQKDAIRAAEALTERYRTDAVIEPFSEIKK